jgi:hypothetical protein
MAGGTARKSGGPQAGAAGLLGGSLGRALSVAAAVVALAGDRGALLVSQSLQAAAAAAVATSGAAPEPRGGPGSWHGTAAAEWLERGAADAAAGAAGAPGVEGLLSLRREGGEAAVAPEALLLARLRELVAWEAGPEYASALAAAGRPPQQPAACSGALAAGPRQPGPAVAGRQ